MTINEQSQLSDEAFVKLAFDAVGREFGVSGLARFVHLTQSKDGDYTRDRYQWFGEQTLDPDEEQPQPESHTQAA